MTKSIPHILLTLVTVIGLLTSCEDHIDYPDNYIPEGHSQLEFNLGFKDFTPALESRSAGDAIKKIDSIWMVIYRNGTLFSRKRITAEEHGLKTEVTANTRPDGKPSGESKTGHASFKMILPNGTYTMYAVANYDLSKHSDADVATPEKLKQLRVKWKYNEESTMPNTKMFGQFFTDSDSSGTIVVKGNASIHAWLNRLASKVTVAYDGTGLKDGVTIHLLGVSIKDIPVSCALGAPNNSEHVNHSDSLIHEGELITYWNDKNVNFDIANITNYAGSITNAKGSGHTTFGDHSDTAEALYFYENMQGNYEGQDAYDKRMHKDKLGEAETPEYDDKGNITNEFKDRIEFGTYIEVEAIYQSTNSERPGHGIIKYRFMLGKDITFDYNAERNHHYKLTLMFNGFANDIDWHIDYTYPMLEADEPLVFDYRGKVFVRDISIPNGGHTFSTDNVVTVRSYMIDDATGKLVPYIIKYKNDGQSEFTTQAPDWLVLDKTENGRFPYEQNLTFKVKPQRSDIKDFTINTLLKNKAQKGTAAAPFNLANPTQGAVTPATATIQNTANCYMIDAPGYYLLPLVYGNAIKNGAPNPTSYQPTVKGKRPLEVFKNHLGNPITSPYIARNTGCTPKSAVLILQDEDKLIDFPDGWTLSNYDVVKYIPNAYNVGGQPIGGIQFYVSPANIKQGNIQLGILVSDIVPGFYVSQQTEKPLMWSWHIWITDFSLIPKSDETLKVTTGITGTDGNKQIVDMMPMNLGWCSSADDVIRYYPERKCEVQFSAGKLTETITIVQKSHIAFTVGNNPYYQWGRKDPFFGTLPGSDAAANNKGRYAWNGWGDVSNYKVMTTVYGGSQGDDKGRRTVAKTIDYEEGLADWIKYPYLWHNPPRKEPGYQFPGTDTPQPFQSLNVTYSNLWGAGNPHDVYTEKTVYDPSPVGYKVPHYSAFAGFTTLHRNTSAWEEWYDAREENIENYINQPPYWQQNATYYNNLYEFYTNPDKTQSIIFPIAGYRDWDNGGYVYRYAQEGYVWTASECLDADKVSNGVYTTLNDWSFMFEFGRKAPGFIRPNDIFFSCDGFSVRPIKE